MPYLKAPALLTHPRDAGGWIGAALVMLLLTGCTTGGSAAPLTSATSVSTALTGPELAYGASPKLDSSINYQGDVVLVGGGASAVESVSADGMIWTIKGTAAHVRDLRPGKILLATGLGAGRVLAVTVAGVDRKVVLGPVDIAYEPVFLWPPTLEPVAFVHESGNGTLGGQVCWCAFGSIAVSVFQLKVLRWGRT